MTLFTHDTENLLSKLIDNANMLILYLDNHGYISMCNKKFEDITGKKRNDILGSHWLNALARNSDTNIKQQMFRAVVDDVMAYKRLNNFEGSLIDSDNKERLISWSISPILLESKDQERITFIEGVLLTGYDITELREREASFKKIDETLKNIFSSIKEYALYATNLDGNITYYSMGSEMMFGWHKSEIVFKHIGILHTKEDAASHLAVILEQVRQSGQYETEIGLVRKDGQRFPAILTVHKFLDADGKPIGYIFIAKDITERKKLQYQVFQAEKLAAIGQLAASMAHEINNPLFVISGRLEMIFEQNGLADNLRKELDIINAQADRIRKLIDRLLKFARQPPPRLEAISINDAIENILPLLSYQKLPLSKVVIEKDLNVGLPTVKGDLSQLQEVFINLLINSYQSMPDGGRLNITTRNLENLFAEVRISDTGCGIAPDNLKNIFMPFFSTKKEGTGLGLSICYNIIKSHSGSIEIESQVNKGTTFIIKLPFA